MSNSPDRRDLHPLTVRPTHLVTRRCLVSGALATSALTATGLRADPSADVDRRSAPLRFARAEAFRNFTGLQVKFNQGEPLRHLADLPDLGVRWVRDSVAWPLLEPIAGRFVSFAAGYAQRLRFYKENNVGVIFVLAYDNPVAYPNSSLKPRNSVDPEAFSRYAEWVARQLVAFGVRFVLEIWNEPHGQASREKLGGGNWNAAPPSPWVAHYIAIVRAVHARIRSLDPSIKLLTNDDMWIIHYWFLEYGLPPDIDGFAVHPYQQVPERAAVTSTASWIRPFTVVDSDGSYRSAVSLLKAHARRKLGRTPEIWVTEMGWAAGRHEQVPGVSPATVAQYLPRAFIGSYAAGVQTMCWFSSMDRGDGPMGLRDNNSLPRPAHTALRVMNDQVGDLVLRAQVAGQSATTQGLQVYWFTPLDESRATGPGDHCLVAWMAGLGNASVSLRVSGVFDHMGKAWPVRRVVQGRATLIRVDANPLYLRGRWSEAELMAAMEEVR